jgi:hypothetical protein
MGIKTVELLKILVDIKRVHIDSIFGLADEHLERLTPEFLRDLSPPTGLDVLLSDLSRGRTIRHRSASYGRGAKISPDKHHFLRQRRKSL